MTTKKDLEDRVRKLEQELCATYTKLEEQEKDIDRLTDELAMALEELDAVYDELYNFQSLQ